jgi:outer membrane lipoprotein-sorting protein
MQKWISQVITILGATVVFSALPPVAKAQLSQTVQGQSQPSIDNTTAPEANSPLSNQPDLALLAKTVANFVKSERYQTESEVQLNATSSGTAVRSSAQVKTLAQSPQQFRSEITFGASGSSGGRKYLVVSNGKQVWIYRPDLKQYAVSDYASFNKSDNSFLIGMSSSLFLEIAPEFKSMRVQGSISDQNIREVLAEMLRSEKTDLKGGLRSLEGRDYYVYEYTDPKEGYTINALVAPDQATVEQIRIVSQSEGVDVVINEKILRRVENPAIAPDTFNFSPPQGAKKVKSISLEPF